MVCMNGRLELELLFSEQRKKEREAFVRVMKEAEQRIVADERARYQRLRAEFGARMTEAEKAMIRQYVLVCSCVCCVLCCVLLLWFADGYFFCALTTDTKK